MSDRCRGAGKRAVTDLDRVSFASRTVEHADDVVGPIRDQEPRLVGTRVDVKGMRTVEVLSCVRAIECVDIAP
jgi:hypothetical protein